MFYASGWMCDCLKARRLAQWKDEMVTVPTLTLPLVSGSSIFDAAVHCFSILGCGRR